MLDSKPSVFLLSFFKLQFLNKCTCSLSLSIHTDVPYSIHVGKDQRTKCFSFCLGLAIIVGEDSGTLLQYSCLENPMDRGAWWAAVHRVAKSLTQLSDFPFTFYFHALEKEMATRSSVLAWRIPGMGEPGGLPSMGSHRVGHD